MKKIYYFLSIFLFLINFQVVFAQEKTENKDCLKADKNTVIVKHAKNEEKILNANITYTLEKKDTNLISIEKTNAVSNSIYNQKIKNDKIIYQKYKKQLKDEYFDLAVILDKLLRANKLQYQNWRIGLDIEPENINAHSGSANLIIVNSSLYDSLYQNQDALAFIVAHELSHLILDHLQISLENNIRIKNLEEQIANARYQADKQNQLGSLNDAVKNYGSSLGNGISSLAYSISAITMNSSINKIYEEERGLEIIADSEAIVLMTRAGYNPEKAKEVIELLSNLPNVYTKRSTHPDILTRKNNFEEALFINDLDELKNQGKKEILNSNVLTIRKSSDKKTIILSKDGNIQKNKYVPISIDEKLIKKAYFYYLDNNYEKSKELFFKAYMVNKENFIPALYLSYINEYEFQQNHLKKSLKKAGRWAKKANKINSENMFVKKQNDDIRQIFIELKENKKKPKDNVT